MKCKPSSGVAMLSRMEKRRQILLSETSPLASPSSKATPTITSTSSDYNVYTLIYIRAFYHIFDEFSEGRIWCLEIATWGRTQMSACQLTNRAVPSRSVPEICLNLVFSWVLKTLAPLFPRSEYPTPTLQHLRSHNLSVTRRFYDALWRLVNPRTQERRKQEAKETKMENIADVVWTGPWWKNRGAFSYNLDCLLNLFGSIFLMVVTQVFATSIFALPLCWWRGKSRSTRVLNTSHTNSFHLVQSMDTTAQF